MIIDDEVASKIIKDICYGLQQIHL